MKNIRFRRILCATDLSEFSNIAVTNAVEMAGRLDAVLYVCHVVDLPVVGMHGTPLVYPDSQIQEMESAAREDIRNLMGKTTVPWEALVGTGPISATICRLAAEREVDLTIVSTRAYTGIKRLFLGSVTERLLRTITCPLLVVTPPEGEKPGTPCQGFCFQRIMVGCDFSEDSKNAVNYGFTLARLGDAELHLVHVVDPDIRLPESLKTGVMESVRNTALKQLEELVPDADLKPEKSVHLACKTGKPFSELTAYAQTHGIDLIVLGIRGHGLVESMMLGATTDRVIRSVSCPVLSVYPM